jgi:hypothetical protein
MFSVVGCKLITSSRKLSVACSIIVTEYKLLCQISHCFISSIEVSYQEQAIIITLLFKQLLFASGFSDFSGL